ncbi:dal80p-controlled protein [Gnomoniopsis smithogilvyi]|uniref:Dal80p-controlled protein n=1 Tax=Gnomoniopsis smithogilvyi TaxID=1191159 RepID=A0A9W8Z3B1_9PEZI|nr:dal80p-controlled protein [Gnomoniopsis smithogilvyi]
MYTAPPNSGNPPSINDDADIQASTKAVWAHLSKNEILKQYTGVLVACYSSHTLVDTIATEHPDILVTGIFEASIAATLPLLRRNNGGGGGWGIVTTGQYWESHLTSAVKEFLGQSEDAIGANKWFRGVFTTGLNAGDFHGAGVSPTTIHDRLADTTRRLLRTGGVDCVIMGCAGMAGLDQIIRKACVEEYGEESAKSVYIIDPVRAGVEVLVSMVRNRMMFLP